MGEKGSASKSDIEQLRGSMAAPRQGVIIPEQFKKGGRTWDWSKVDEADVQKGKKAEEVGEALVGTKNKFEAMIKERNEELRVLQEKRKAEEKRLEEKLNADRARFLAEQETA